MIEEIFEVMWAISAEGVSVPLVEHDARLALQGANDPYAMDWGLVTMF